MMEIDPDKVNLSPAAVKAWQEMCDQIAIAIGYMAEMGREIPPIPDERARINDDGSLTIFVEIPDIMSVSMNVPADQWEYRH